MSSHVVRNEEPDFGKQAITLSKGIRRILRAFAGEHPAFLFACLFLVMEYNKLQHVYPVIDVIPWGSVTLALPMLLALVDRNAGIPPKGAVVLVAVFGMCVGISIIDAFEPSISMNNWERFASPMLMVLMLTTILQTRQRLLLFVVVYFLVNLKMAQHGFLTWAGRGFSFQGWGVTGSPVWFQNSGEFAMQMAVFLPMVLALIVGFRHEWSRSVRWVFYLIVLMAIGSIIASGSRGGMLGLMGVGIWLLMFSRKKLRAMLVVAIVSASVFFMTPEELKEDFSQMGDDQTSISRLTYWEHALQTVEENPWTGVGFLNWPEYAAVRYPETVGLAGRGGAEVVHNTFLEAMTDMGYPGGVVYLTIVIYIVVTNVRSARRAAVKGDQLLMAFARGTNGALLAFLITSFFMSVLYYPVIWMLLVFTVSIGKLVRSAEEVQKQKPVAQGSRGAPSSVKKRVPAASGARS